MDDNNEELKKDLEEQYAMLEEEIQEDKKKKRYLIIFIFFLCMFLIVFGTTFSYYRLYDGIKEVEEESIINDLYVEGYEDAFEFDPEIYSYVITVPNKTKNINVHYVLNNDNYLVEIIGNDSLEPGANEVQVIIKDKDGKEVKKYIIYVNVEEIIQDDVIIDNDGNDNIIDNGPANDGSTNQEFKDLSLKNLDVTNHKLNDIFDSSKTTYIVDDIKTNEDEIVVNFGLVDGSNEVLIKLNDITITRKPEVNGNDYSIKFNVDTELNVGTNKLEIIVKDENGNEKIYTVYLVVSEKEEQKVVEISVDYGNDNGSYVIAGIIPGWQSVEKQHFTVTNSSNYNTNVDVSWTNVSNNFVNTTDLEYTFYKDNTVIKKGILPTENEVLIDNLKIAANSKNNYYISYKYIYSEEDQNIDQGKTFSAVIKVTLSK